MDTNIKLLADFGLAADAAPIGEGAQAVIYRLDDERALRIFQDVASARTITQRADFLTAIRDQTLWFATPEYLEWGVIDNTLFAIERLLPGTNMAIELGRLRGVGRLTAWTNYAEAVHEIHRLSFNAPGFGDLYPHTADAPIRAKTWNEYLNLTIDNHLALYRPELSLDVPHLEGSIARLRKSIHSIPEPAPGHLVHGDFFPGNVMIDESHNVTAVIHWSEYCVVGDPLLDLAGALTFLETQVHIEPSDLGHVRSHLVTIAGDHILKPISVYRSWIALMMTSRWYRQNSYRHYSWAIKQVRTC